MNDVIEHQALPPADVGELIRAINNMCVSTQTQINQVCSSINQTNTTIIEDRQIASVGVSQLAEALHDSEKTQREINSALFLKIGNLAEAVLAQAKTTSEQTKAIGKVTTAINNLAIEFSEHRGKSEQREITARQSQQHTKDSLDRITLKVDKTNEDTNAVEKLVNELHIEIEKIKQSREDKKGFFDSTFSKSIAILTLLAAFAAVMITLNSNSQQLPPPHNSRLPHVR